MWKEYSFLPYPFSPKTKLTIRFKLLLYKFSSRWDFHSCLREIYILFHGNHTYCRYVVDGGSILLPDNQTHPSVWRSPRWPRWHYYTLKWTLGSGLVPELAWTQLPSTHTHRQLVDHVHWIPITLCTGVSSNIRTAISRAGLTDAGFNMKEAGLGQVSQESKWALPHLRHSVLHRKRF